MLLERIFLMPEIEVPTREQLVERARQADRNPVEFGVELVKLRRHVGLGLP